MFLVSDSSLFFSICFSETLLSLPLKLPPLSSTAIRNLHSDSGIDCACVTPSCFPTRSYTSNLENVLSVGRCEILDMFHPLLAASGCELRYSFKKYGDDCTWCFFPCGLTPTCSALTFLIKLRAKTVGFADTYTITIKTNKIIQVVGS